MGDSWDEAVETVSETSEALTETVTDAWEGVSDTAATVRDGVVAFAEDPKGTTVEFVTEDVPEWVAENESTVNRIAGGMQVAGGLGETALGVAIVPTGAATFGTTSVLGAGVAAHGLDTTWAGLRALWTGEAQETYTQQGVTAVADAVPGVDTETAEAIGLWTDIGLGIAGPVGASRAILNSADNVAAEALEGAARASADDAVGVLDNLAGDADEVTGSATALGNANDNTVSALDDVTGGVTDDAGSLTDDAREGAGELFGGASEEIADSSALGDFIPQKASNIADQVQQNNGSPLSGYKGGRTFLNDARAGGKTLPQIDMNGSSITYREYDIYPYQKGVNRGTERIVVGSDGSRYYTNDHYQTFTRF